MKILAFAVCSLLFCLLKSGDVIGSAHGETIDKTLDSFSKDWGSMFQEISILENSVAKMDTTLKAIETRLDILEERTQSGSGSDATYEEIKKDVKKLKHSLDKCCNQKSGHKPKGPVGPNRDFTIDVDDAVDLYLDGKRVEHFQHGTEWRTADTAVLPGNTRVIGLKGTNSFGDPGMLGSTADGYVLTNTSWKCTHKESKGWAKHSFDDSKWPQAVVVLPYSQKPVVGIREDADWIWTKNYKLQTGDRIVYCRRKL